MRARKSSYRTEQVPSWRSRRLESKLTINTRFITPGGDKLVPKEFCTNNFAQKFKRFAACVLEAIALKCLSRLPARTSADRRAGVVDEISLHVYRVARFDEERMHPHLVRCWSSQCCCHRTTGIAGGHEASRCIIFQVSLM